MKSGSELELLPKLPEGYLSSRITSAASLVFGQVCIPASGEILHEVV